MATLLRAMQAELVQGAASPASSSGGGGSGDGGSGGGGALMRDGTLRVVRLRNPHGRREWKGAFGARAEQVRWPRC